MGSSEPAGCRWVENPIKTGVGGADHRACMCLRVRLRVRMCRVRGGTMGSCTNEVSPLLSPQLIKQDKGNGRSWFTLRPKNQEGVEGKGTCKIFVQDVKYEFELEVTIPATVSFIQRHSVVTTSSEVLTRVSIRRHHPRSRCPNLGKSPKSCTEAVTSALTFTSHLLGTLAKELEGLPLRLSRAWRRGWPRRSPSWSKGGCCDARTRQTPTPHFLRDIFKPSDRLVTSPSRDETAQRSAYV